MRPAISGSRNAKLRARSGQVEIAVEAGGICGSDLHYFNHGGFGTVRVREPMILGHEVAGTIKALGATVSGLAIGDRVAVSPSRPCNGCDYSSAIRNKQFYRMRRSAVLAWRLK